MSEAFSRTELLFGKEAMQQLTKAHIALFGVGGVGGYALEALARSGVGSFTLVDNDRVTLSNLNRQIIATNKTIGQYKVDAACERVHEINESAVVITKKVFVLPENIDEFDFSSYDYVIDAIDTVSAKIALVVACSKADVPIISAMGAGNKVDPTRLEVTDISKTSVCPLARVMRIELRKRGINHLKVVYSKEEPIKAQTNAEILDGGARRSTPGSTSFVPAAAGLIIASTVVKDLIGYNKREG